MDSKMRDIDNSPDQDYTRSAADPPPYSGPGSYRAEPTYVGAPQPTATVIQRPAIVVAQNNYLAPNPQPYYCRSCNQQIVTKVEKVNTMKTHLFAALFCVTGLWCCVCVPYCMDTCKKADHYCPQCSSYFGSNQH